MGVGEIGGEGFSWENNRVPQVVVRGTEDVVVLLVLSKLAANKITRAIVISIAFFV
jgi:hypothetical protein